MLRSCPVRVHLVHCSIEPIGTMEGGDPQRIKGEHRVRIENFSRQTIVELLERSNRKEKNTYKERIILF